MSTSNGNGKQPGALNRKQRAFVFEYVKDKNGTQAAIRAGYSPATAVVQASQLLTNLNVAAAIDRALYVVEESVRESSVVTKQWVMDMLVENVKRSMALEAVTDKEGKPIGTYRYQGAVANKALELLGSELGMFREEALPAIPWDDLSASELAQIEQGQWPRRLQLLKTRKSA